ncbi:hypothetical protein A2767_03805 [Candidatus Roizmanbacteria bacterium RIFCSPHIGHO2_01_FULL_35_10]|uniref:Transcriptional repressor n=1 Tax=Candidatus Roizmanbacteria bacterium RIFCSPLOWO2_01_FULL_35_13 TaxID=1802055 RepID=A0A1F7IA72_9BACT|nr:MAG: hypothetical protein A2767_03805 [Candidatus Roizmanbacteria bacterium RIFCSPHIGHO2_01_FULL_35_10]OGK40249.1 MAG: hypothetical protein A3A74_07120 [Candidatus Roizmanbacteria bacterium RIFCSPLOWO2_01_FULL_35_13]
MNTFAKLRSKGHRITDQRERILQKIKSHPQTVEEIHESLDKKVNLASVYRTLKLFVKNKAVRVINFGDGKKRYELLDEKNHHHHFTCNNCKSIEDISSQLEEKLIEDIQLKSKLKIASHSLELFGVCHNCT